MNPFLLPRDHRAGTGQWLDYAPTDLLFGSRDLRVRRLYGQALERIRRRSEPREWSGWLFFAAVVLACIVFAIGVLIPILF